MNLLRVFLLKRKLAKAKNQLSPANRQWAENLEARLKTANDPAKVLLSEVQRVSEMQMRVAERLNRLENGAGNGV